MKILSRLATISYYVAWFFALLIWLAAFCPLALMTNCSITNSSNGMLSVTPVGAVGLEGQRKLLPLYRTSFPFFAKSKLGNFQVEPGEIFRFNYDMDDINFSEIVIENSSGERRQIVVNPNPTRYRYVVPEETDFTIDDFNSLPAVPTEVQTAAFSARHAGYMWFIYLVSGMLILVECVRMVIEFRKRTGAIAT